MNRPRYCVGIDPGKTTGVAVYDRHEKKLVKVMSTDFWGCYDSFYASEFYDYDVIIEVSSTKSPFSDKKTPFSTAKAHTMSFNIGMVYGQSIVLADGLERMGYNVKRVHPTGAGKRLDDKQIRAMTGWDKQTNIHTRDAIMLCYGK